MFHTAAFLLIAAIIVSLMSGFKPEEAEGIKVYKGLGCANCANTGYRGRMAIHEILYINPELQDAIVKLRQELEIVSAR